MRTNIDYLAQAIEDDPAGATCAFCGEINSFADDCGWFYIKPSANLEGFTCEECFRGPLGEAHQQRYGVGDR